MPSPHQLLLPVCLLHRLALASAWIPFTLPASLQSYATSQLRPMQPPRLLHTPDLHPRLHPHLHPDFRKPRTQTFYSAALSPHQPPVYQFRYKVHDPEEDNYQEKSEVRVGDSVRGYYSVREPNGYVRLVRYVSDENGFQTQVSHHHEDDHGGGPSFTARPGWT